MSSAQFELLGVIGQPDATQTPMTGGGFELSGGFLVGGTACIADTDDGSGTARPTEKWVSRTCSTT